MQLTPDPILAPGAENNDSSMGSNQSPLTMSSGSTDPEEHVWIHGCRERTGLRSNDVDEMSSSRPSSPLPSNSSSTIYSVAAKLLKQTIGRPIAALLSCQDRFSAYSPRSEAHYSRNFMLVIMTYSLLSTLLIPLLIAGFRLTPTLSDDPDAEFLIDFFTMLEAQGRMANAFSGKTTGVGLAKKFIRTEIATSDLISAVRFSGLLSSDILAKELSVSAKHASDTADLLLNLDVKAMGTVESLLYIHEQMFKAIEKASQYSPGLTALFPFVQKNNPMDIVHRNFIGLMSIEEEALFDLIRLATDAYARLVLVKEHLQGIRDLAYHDLAYHDLAHLGDVRSSFRILFGANGAEIRTFQRNLELLKSLDGYTGDAKVHGAITLSYLKALQSQLRGLREKAALPIVGNASSIDMHVKMLDEGLRRVMGLIKGERL